MSKSKSTQITFDIGYDYQQAEMGVPEVLSIHTIKLNGVDLTEEFTNALLEKLEVFELARMNVRDKH